MLDNIVGNMVYHLNGKFKQLEQTVEERVRFEAEQQNQRINQGLKKHIKKLQKKVMQLNEKQQYSTTLLYNLKIGTEEYEGINIDKVFRQITRIGDPLESRGYGNSSSSAMSAKLQAQAEQ